MLKQFRKTKIIATLGPSTDYDDNLKKMIQAGVNVVRLNFSHGKIEDHYARANKVREISNHLGCFVGILGDLQGPKIRIAMFKNNHNIFLEKGNKFILDATLGLSEGDKYSVGINYVDLYKDVLFNDILLLDDGKIKLKVLNVKKYKIYTEVIVGGILSDNKGINKLGGGLSANSLTDKDKSDIIMASKIGVDYLAISFPRTANDILSARNLSILEGSKAKIVAKIERAEVVFNEEVLNSIILASDAVMIARGDLGVEVGETELVGLQKKIIFKAHYLNRTVITATQMMDSMIFNPVPTRAEVLDVSNAVIDGTDAVMLSAETASGKYPIETVTTMSNICLGAEKFKDNVSFSIEYDYYLKYTETNNRNLNISNVIVQSVKNMINNTFCNISAVIDMTYSDIMVKLMSCMHFKKPIFYLHDNVSILNLTTLYKGVIPYFFKDIQECNNDNLNATVKFYVKNAIQLLKNQGFLNAGEKIVILLQVQQNNSIQNALDVNVEYINYIIHIK